MDYVKVVETAPEVMQTVKSQKRSADGEVSVEIQVVRDLVAGLSPRVERLWRRGTNGLNDADADLQNQAAKTKMLEVVHGFAGGMAARGQVRLSRARIVA